MGKFVGPFLRAAFNYDADEVSLETGTACHGASLAQQSFAEECDINVIVRRFGVGVPLPITQAHVS